MEAFEVSLKANLVGKMLSDCSSRGILQGQNACKETEVIPVYSETPLKN